MRSSPDCAIGQPMRAPIVGRLGHAAQHEVAHQRVVEDRDRSARRSAPRPGSSSCCPTACTRRRVRTSALASAWKPALGERGADARRRAPRRRRAARRRSAARRSRGAPRPGAGLDAARWTTQPRTRSSGSRGEQPRRRDRRSRAAPAPGIGRGQEPPRHAVHRRQQDRRRAEQRRQRGADGGQRRRLERR